MKRSALWLIAIGLASSGCASGGYLLHLGWGQGKILLGRVAIEDEIESPDISEARKAKLRLVQEAKRWAVERVGLHDGGTYSTVFDTGKGPAVWNVSACKNDEFAPGIWEFPIVGAVPYKGFFELSLAEREKRELEEQGYDVLLYGAAAYSTLGWFRDPLFTSMLRGDEGDLVATVIHEMTHATVYVNGDAEFNETLAEFVGEQGAIDFFRSVDGPGSKRAKACEDSFHDDQVFSRGIQALKTRLEEIYDSPISHEEKLARKRRELDDFPRRYRAEIRPELRTDEHDGYATRRLNNAIILALERYHGEMDVFAALHKKLGADLAVTVRALHRIAEAENPHEALKREAQ
jgi:predicted aminopeptidase